MEKEKKLYSIVKTKEFFKGRDYEAKWDMLEAANEI